jgi:phosphoribosylamine--glycine ligase
MNILILGGGGREHALAWAVKQNPKTDRLIVAPGNAGIAMLAECADIDILDGSTVVAFCEDNAIDFVIIGPEAPLAAGVADACRQAGLLTFGPSAAAARLEASKAFTKAICDACAAPTAAYARFTEAAPARAYIAQHGAPIVVKADGLAAGKGVIVAMTEAEALAAIDDMFGGEFGAAGAEVVIEEFMQGEEASFFILTDGTTALPIGTAQDHKRAGDGDTGPNTGGMGAYSPAPILTEAVQKQAMDEIVLPTLREMALRGMPYQGVLYAGLMIENGRARLVEYNARFGDPECQVLMLRLGAQALDLMLACAEGRLADARVNWADDHALTVVMAANGYPGAYAKGSQIRGLEELPEDSRHMVFHAGTALRDGSIIASGGRVLNVTARGATLREAHDAAYAMVDAIDWPGGFCRRDIGWRALNPPSSNRHPTAT